MTKKLALTLLAISSSAVLFLNGCSKDDTTAPVVTVNGSASETVSLQGSWTDPLATATDDEDGTVSVTSDASATNPNLNKVGVYTITYSATDAAGNVGTAIRTVTVKNDADAFAKTYAVSDVVPGVGTFTYNQTITVDETMNNRVHFSRFGDYANNTSIYAERDASSNKLSIPLQSTGSAVGSGAGQCDVVIHYFRSTSFMNLATGFTLDYVDSIGGNTGGQSTCNGSSTPGTATYTF